MSFLRAAALEHRRRHQRDHGRRRLPELERLAELLLGGRRIAEDQGGLAKQQARLAVLRLLLQHVPQLDDGGLVIALGLVVARGAHQRAGSSRPHPEAGRPRSRRAARRPIRSFEKRFMRHPIRIRRFDQSCLRSPKRFSRSYSVGRLTPSRSAAFDRLPFTRASARTHFAPLGALARLPQVQRLVGRGGFEAEIARLDRRAVA